MSTWTIKVEGSDGSTILRTGTDSLAAAWVEAASLKDGLKDSDPSWKVRKTGYGYHCRQGSLAGMVVRIRICYTPGGAH